MIQRLQLIFASLLLAFGSQAMAAKKSIPMVLPAPIQIPQGVAQEDAIKALKSALAGRGWQPQHIQPGVVDGLLEVRKHMLKLRFTLSQGKIHTHYLHSAVLGYEVDDGVPKIHPSVMRWTKNLEMDLRSKLLQY